MNTHSSKSNRVVCAAPLMVAFVLAAHPASAQGTPAALPAAMPASAQHPGTTALSPDIRDIRGPKPILAPWLIPLLAATGLTAAGGAYLAWAWNRRRFREASKRPLDIALERLDRARSLMLPQRGREFSIEVSCAVRDYIEGRFDLRAAHLTTDEFLHQLMEPAESPLAAHRSQLDNFLQTCDLAKFGGWNLAASDMEAMLQSAWRFIVESAGDSADRPTRAAAALPAERSSTPALRDTYVSFPST